jgi:hypothetical protein
VAHLHADLGQPISQLCAGASNRLSRAGRRSTAGVAWPLTLDTDLRPAPEVQPSASGAPSTRNEAVNGALSSEELAGLLVGKKGRADSRTSEKPE